MAYNVVQSPSGLAVEQREQLNKIDKIDHAIDNFSDEKIGGNKIFTKTVIAKGFQLHDGREITPPAVEVIKNNQAGSLLLATGTPLVETTPNLSYDNGVLLGRKLKFDSIEGNGSLLSHLDAGALEGTLNLETIKLPPNSAISTANNQLYVDFDAATPMSKTGQTVSDGDKLLLFDTSQNGLRQTTFAELYRDYIKTKGHHPGGNRQSLQFRKGNTFGGAETLRFDEQKNTLNLAGTLNAMTARIEDELVAEGALRAQGATYQKITHTNTPEYEVQADDYTVLADTADNKVCVILPDASENDGRVLNIKLINSEKYRIKGNKLVIKSAGGLLDIYEEVILKMTTSSRSFQSDGKTWWIINGRGS
jgi:hypothetical protein